MADIAAIRAGMANAVKAIAGMQTWPNIPGSIVAPAFASGEVEIDYDKTFRGGAAGLAELVVKGRLYAGTADTPAGQAALDSYLAPSGLLSVKAAIEADLTLGGTCKTLRVERVHSYAIYNVGGTEYYGAQFEVRVWA
jgi:hypothetical protein